MKFEVINRKFTETVAEWMAKGYTINTASMGGSQGEIAKIDLTDGTEIVRVLLDGFTTHPTRGGNRHYSLEGVKLVVGRVTDKVVPNSEDTWSHIWNNRLEILSCEDFYQIGEPHRNGAVWYGSESEAMAQQDKNRSRFHARWVSCNQDLGDAAKELVLPYVRRQPKCKTIKASEIESVTRRSNDRNSKNHYYIKVRGKELRLK